MDPTVHLGRMLDVQATMTMQAEHVCDEFVFTLYHGYQVRHVTVKEADMQNEKEEQDTENIEAVQVSFTQEFSPDTLTIRTDQPVCELVVQIDYSGYANRFFCLFQYKSFNCGCSSNLSDHNGSKLVSGCNFWGGYGTSCLWNAARWHVAELVLMAHHVRCCNRNCAQYSLDGSKRIVYHEVKVKSKLKKVGEWMGIYLNPGSAMFQKSLRSKIYVDKSGLLAVLNELVDTEQRYVCVSRPRRFGKSMAANMLAAYYGSSEDASALFASLEISQHPGYFDHLNQYDVLKINMQDFLSESQSIEDMLAHLTACLIRDLRNGFPQIDFCNAKSLVQVMREVFAQTGRSFIILIDEWDCLFREYESNKEAQKQYLDFLRVWLKDKEYVGLAYMTGILPIKKYGSHSALNMFTEYSMTNPREMAGYFGFTEDEVKKLCETYQRSFDETQAWYDGYDLVMFDGTVQKTYAMYSPKSVVEAMLSGVYDNYWNQTESYEALKVYIQMNYDGLKEAIVRMLAGDRVQINTGTFSNDMTTFETKDDVLTLLVHLGYLSYHWPDKTVTIPNKEVSQEYVNAISTMAWNEVIRSIENSRKLLQALWEQDEKAVAEGIDQAHGEISVLQYNNDNLLSCTIMLAFYFAREYYHVIRELPTGKGFADICLIPRKKYAQKPAAIIELKWDKSAEGAIAQIKEKKYPEALEDYHGNLLLAGINYDKKSRKHTCKIEKLSI